MNWAFKEKRWRNKKENKYKIPNKSRDSETNASTLITKEPQMNSEKVLKKMPMKNRAEKRWYFDFDDEELKKTNANVVFGTIEHFESFSQIENNNRFASKRGSTISKKAGITQLQPEELDTEIKCQTAFIDSWEEVFSEEEMDI